VGRGSRGGRGATGAGLAGEGRARGQGRARNQGKGARLGEEERDWEGERGRGKGRGGEAHLGDPNSSDHRLKTLGHHGERERERWKREREVTAWEKSNERKGIRGRGARMGRTGGARGARAGPSRTRPGWARLGHIVDQNPRHAQPPIGIRSRTENQNGTRRTRE
jgi:hypothetical protein